MQSDMAMGTERSKALHNFTLPGGLRWGNQRHLRCMKVDSDAQVSPMNRLRIDDPDSFDNHHNKSIPQRRTVRDGERDILSSELFSHGSGGDKDGGVAAVREKVMFDLQKATDKMKDAIFREGCEGVVSASPPPLTVEGEAYRPWNLRTRRAACKTPMSFSPSANDGFDGGKSLGIPLVTAAAAVEKTSRLRSGGDGAAASGDKRERARFSVSLSKSEIEEDFLALVNHRPPRRPKKRAKFVQKQLDLVFPGMWLTEVTVDMYKVSEIRR